jgi:hypothetical protein
VALLTLGCSGGLLVDQGNAFPCAFDDPPQTRDQACPSGWICGVTNRCQKDKPEGLPAELARPVFDGQGQIQPAITRGPIVGLATVPSSKVELASIAGVGTWFLSAGFGAPVGPDPVARGAVAEPANGSPGAIALQTGVSALTSLLSDGGTVPASAPAPIFGLRAPPAGGALPLVVQTWSKAAGARVYPLNPAGAVGPSPDGGAGTVRDLRFVASAQLGLTGDAGAPVYVLTQPDGGPTLLMGLAADYPLTDPLAPQQPVSLQHSADGELWSLAYSRPLEDGGISPGWLSAYSQSTRTEHAFTVAIDPCRPCPIGSPVAMTPISGPDPTVEVACSNALAGGSNAHPQLLAISAGSPDPTTGACRSTPLLPTFDPGEVSSLADDSVGGFIALGGAHGQIWAGSSLSTLLPMRLDRIPEGLGEVNLTIHATGDRFTLPLAFTDDYMAVDFGGALGVGGTDGYAVIGAPSEVGEEGPPPGILPRAAIEGIDGWLVGSDAVMVHVTLEDFGTLDDPKVKETVKFGPRLLGPGGAPAQPPYLGTVTLDPKSFFLAAGDSLYLYEVGPAADGPDQLPPLTPKLTPQFGFPIRALTLDTSDGQAARIHGYAVTSNTLYEFQLAGTPEHWSGHPIVLSGDEPVKVWMQDAKSPYGRVGYRDGTLFTLPDGLPLAQALRGPDGGAERVLDFANLGGWPVALASSGIYAAARPDGGSRLLGWEKVTLPDGGEPWLQDGRLQDGKLVTQPTDGGVTLRLFAEHGIVYEVGHAAP